MRVLLDENVPVQLAPALTGHDVWTVGRKRWSGIKNGSLLRRAAAEFDVFITLDRSIPYQQNLPSNFALVTLRAKGNRPRDVVPLAPQILEAPTTIQAGDRILFIAPAD